MQLSSVNSRKIFGLALFVILIGGSSLEAAREARTACADGEPEPFCECSCGDLIGRGDPYYEIRKWWDEGGEQMCEDLDGQLCRSAEGEDGIFTCRKIYYCPTVEVQEVEVQFDF